MAYIDKAVFFDFENKFCLRNLQVWQNEARNLFYSAEVLHQFELKKVNHIWNKDELFVSIFPSTLVDRMHFNHRVQRMLWAYGFENLLKLMILADYKVRNPGATEVPFKKIKIHGLRDLAKIAKITLSEPETFYLGVLEKCSVWAGRYPLPLRPNQMYDQREPLATSEALLERSRITHEKWLNGEIPRVICESDVLLSGINEEEFDVYGSLKSRLLDHSDRLLVEDQGT